MTSTQNQATSKLIERWQDASFWQWQQQYQPSAYLLAVSGGLDSMALMHLLGDYKSWLQAPIKVVYINHLWREEAQQWRDFVHSKSQSLGFAFQSNTVNYELVKQSSPEAMAREARYQLFAQMMSDKTVLLTAHHEDDQAETLLLQLLRGSGLAGLASMPERATFASGQHWRPLLGFSREMIEAYVRENNIAYVNDPSNEDQRYERNWLRKQVMPLLKEKHPKATQNLALSATWLGEALSLQSSFLSRYFSHDNPDCLTISPWINEPLSLQKAVVREWLRRLNIAPLPHKQQVEFLRQIQQRTGHPTLIHHGVALVTYDDSLFAYRHTMIKAPKSVEQLTNWQGIGELEIHTGAEKLFEMTGDLRWSLYPPGGQFRPTNKQHHHSLKEWFRRQRVPPYLRERMPILRLNDEIIWVAGLGSAFGYEWLGINWQKKAHSVSISSYPLSVSDTS